MTTTTTPKKATYRVTVTQKQGQVKQVIVKALTAEKACIMALRNKTITSSVLNPISSTTVEAV